MSIESLLSRTDDLLTRVDQLLLGQVLVATQTFDSATTDADPGNGAFRFNHATFASITKVWIDNLDSNGASIAEWLATWGDGTSAIRGTLVLRGVTVGNAFRIFDVTGAVLDKTGYREVTVAPVVTGGTWTAGEKFAAVFMRTGDKGDKGDKGDTGNTGASYAATSASSLALGTGSKTFATQAGLAYQVGSRVRAADAANPATGFMEGVVTSYSAGSLVVAVDYVVGSGTIADWLLSITGDGAKEATASAAEAAISATAAAASETAAAGSATAAATSATAAAGSATTATTQAGVATTQATAAAASETAAAGSATAAAASATTAETHKNAAQTARTGAEAALAAAEAIVDVEWHGAWNSGTAYSIADAVEYGGAAYISIQTANTNHEPDTSPLWWHLLGTLGTGDMVAALWVDTDGALTANSDTKVASQKATLTAINAAIAAAQTYADGLITALKAGVSTAFDTLAEIATELGLKAPIASPTFTGTPAAPTAAPGTDTTQIATTAFVAAAIGGIAAGMAVAARQTESFSAAAGTIYPCDTTSAAIMATLPGSPTQGARIGFYDVGRAWATNNLTIGRNGNNIAGNAGNLICNVQGGAFVLVWDAARGWQLGV